MSVFETFWFIFIRLSRVEQEENMLLCQEDEGLQTLIGTVQHDTFGRVNFNV